MLMQHQMLLAGETRPVRVTPAAQVLCSAHLTIYKSKHAALTPQWNRRMKHVLPLTSHLVTLSHLGHDQDVSQGFPLQLQLHISGMYRLFLRSCLYTLKLGFECPFGASSSFVD